jgi:hypothetical protein
MVDKIEKENYFNSPSIFLSVKFDCHFLLVFVLFEIIFLIDFIFQFHHLTFDFILFLC